MIWNLPAFEMSQHCCHLDMMEVFAADLISWLVTIDVSTDLEVIKLEYNLKLKIKRNDWLLADTCPQAANPCALFEFETELKFYNLEARYLWGLISDQTSRYNSKCIY